MLSQDECALYRQRISSLEESIGIDRSRTTQSGFSDIRSKSKIRELNALRSQCENTSKQLEHSRLEAQARVSLFVNQQQNDRKTHIVSQ